MYGVGVYMLRSEIQNGILPGVHLIGLPGHTGYGTNLTTVRRAFCPLHGRWYLRLEIHIRFAGQMSGSEVIVLFL